VLFLLFSYSTRFSLQDLGGGVTQVGCLATAYVLCEGPAWTARAFNADTSAARARTSFVILLERLVIEMGTPVLRL
jgi:hypothetical protein